MRATPRTNPVRAKVYSSIVVGNMACGGVVRAIDLRRFENVFVSVQSEIQKQWRKRRPLGNGFFKMLAKQVWRVYFFHHWLITGSLVGKGV